MSFVDEVNRIKNGVLSKPEYSEPIKSVLERANSYTAEIKFDEKMAEENEVDLEK